MHSTQLLDMLHSRPIRCLVEKALFLGLLTPEIEQGINSELDRLGYLPVGDSEALELLMSEMDAGRIRLVPSYPIGGI
jgi:hypothetical protein